MPVSAQTETEPKEDQALLDVGKTALRKLSPLAPGETQTLDFRVIIGPETEVGFVQSRLTRPQGTREDEYDYHTESVIMFPNGAKIGIALSGRLKLTFEPIELNLAHSIYQPESGEQLSEVRTVLDADKVRIRAGRGDEKTSTDAPRPPDPIIYGIESMIPRLDRENFPLFALREFDIQSGSAGYLSVAVEKWTDGTPTVVTRRADGNGSYQFWFDENGEFLRWGEPSLPVLFVRTTSDRMNELRKRFGAAPTPAGTGEKADEK